MSVPDAAEGVLLDVAATAPAVAVRDLLAEGGALLVIAPHPDDETLGCGAALMAALAAGVAVTVALLTDGGASHPASRTHPPDVMMELRRAEFAAALAALEDGARRVGANNPRVDAVRLGLADANVVADVSRAVDLLAREVFARGVGTVWTTSGHDPHADHAAAAVIADRIADTARNVVRRDYCVWSRFGDAGRHIARERVRRFGPERFAEAKREAMACYASQLTPLVVDDPAGFMMPAALVAHFATSAEIFVAPGPA